MKVHFHDLIFLVKTDTLFYFIHLGVNAITHDEM